MVSLHFTEDMCCLGGLEHESNIPCSQADLGLWPKQSPHRTSDFLSAFIGVVILLLKEWRRTAMGLMSMDLPIVISVMVAFLIGWRC